MTFFFSSVFVLLVFWRPQEWLVPWLFGVPMLDIVVGLSLLTLIIETNQGIVKIPHGMPQLWLYVGLWLATLMSHIVHTYWEFFVKVFPETFKVCFFGFLLFCLLDRVRRMRTVVGLVLAMGILMAIHALLQQSRGYGFAGQPPIAQYRPLTDTTSIRSLFFGIFEDPNDMAQFLAVCVPLAFAWQRRMGFVGRIAGLGVAALLVSGIIATDSRGGNIGLAISAAVMLALLLPARWMPRALLLVLISGLVLCPLSGGQMDASAHDRVVFWGEANWAFKHNMIFGVGYGLFSDFVSGDRAAHNIFVECYTSIGLFGYWFWFNLLQLAFIGAWRVRVALVRPENREQEWVRRMAGMGLASLAGLCSSGYFLSRAFIFPVFLMVAIVGALPIVAKSVLPAEYPPIIYAKPDAMVLGTVGTLASVAYVYFSIILLNKAFYG